MEQLNNHIKGAKHKKKIECEKIKITGDSITSN